MCTCLPARVRKAGDRGLSIAENPRGRVIGSNPSESRGQHHGNLLGRGFQPIQRRVTSSTEHGMASLAAKRLDALDAAMFAISLKTHGCEPR